MKTDASDSRVVLLRRKRNREDKARKAAQALSDYTEFDPDLRSALVNFLADAMHLATLGGKPLDQAGLVKIVNDAMWCAGDEEDHD